MSYTERLPDELRDAFIDKIVNIYLETYPLDAAGVAHVRMVQLEVEASKPVE